MDKLVIRQAAAADMAAVRALCWDYRAVLVERNQATPEVVERYYKAETYAELLTQLPLLHTRPDGAIFVAVLDGTIVGCGMTLRIDAQTCEIKRVFVAPAARGHGVARKLCSAAMDRAREDGYQRMVLDTMRCLTEAIKLYQNMGFSICAPYHNLNPDHAEHILFFEKRLTE